MYRNIKKNRFWLVTAIETLVLGVSFVSVPTFDSLPWLSLADDPRLGMLLVAAGIFSIVVSLWDIHWNGARRLMTGILAGLWLGYTVMFVVFDLSSPVKFPSWTTILATAVFVRILAEAGWGHRD